MNYTQNYHLPQWVKEDRIMMEDFNDAMSNIETGLVQTAQKTSAAASTASSAASAASKAAAAAQNAQDTADEALEKASAAYSSDNLPCVMGIYEGTGKDIDIDLGFQPRFIVLWGTGNQGQSTPSTCVVLTTGKHGGSILTLTSKGFRIVTSMYNSTVNAVGQYYSYLAFR